MATSCQEQWRVKPTEDFIDVGIRRVGVDEKVLRNEMEFHENKAGGSG